jgi:molybdenum cofactor biosynthesis protein B
MAIDESRPFIALRVAVVTISDTRTLDNDVSGDLLVERLELAGHRVARRTILPDDLQGIIAHFRALVADPEVDCVLATGGTGVTGRDVTPEAVEAVADKLIPGFGELFRWLSFQAIGTSTIQSRACACVSRGTFIFALPGSPGAVRDAWDGILLTQLDSRHRPCNFVELVPRLMES